MGFLQKMFDKSAKAVNDAHDSYGDDPVMNHPVAATTITLMGFKCEAAVLAAKLTGRRIDTSKAGFGGYLF